MCNKKQVEKWAIRNGVRLETISAFQRYDAANDEFIEEPDAFFDGCDITGLHSDCCYCTALTDEGGVVNLIIDQDAVCSIVNNEWNND